MDRKKTPENNTPKFNGYVHIDTFLDTAKTLFNMRDSQVAGFKAYMEGSHYLFSEQEFLPSLEKYLGRKLDI
ncbi:hypothetical protein phi_Fi200W_ORF073 [Staphylococcus phage Fi200W]|uniref:Phage protein n=4 Tax=Kayvirus G1 TaxID=292029 RepID=I6WJI2_9CAUD|nr:hypothetical protein QLX30_gp098 [Staphylococcus phage A3R]YP_009781018.1 hypothetical protein QLX31_gp100 [Staphylococcus phage 676Z]YP_009781251.1 hypothetical protein QLX32_gp100 [Staphylococcus phage Fi200W]YP_009781715.1 hypothetical protein QLX34_gp099 [Staphylococcus phage P4W]AFN38128.1 hypothetical protein phi_A3R_ORF073 [Staphylococcus phage A3R]AFN38322.1 hypothetical protein phi_676Z_ORF073 [Staphylococcus phage 676Z]AFN38534.1 hypothetical protein phi_Fi200W_ORF073 [Staphyloco